MKPWLALSLALAIALTGSAAFAADGGAKPLHSRWAIHHRIVAAPRAEAPDPAPLFRASAPGIHETDGLSRDPGDCLKYGCIDSGGG